jgi:hypothetical protein
MGFAATSDGIIYMFGGYGSNGGEWPTADNRVGRQMLSVLIKTELKGLF